MAEDPLPMSSCAVGNNNKVKICGVISKVSIGARRIRANARNVMNGVGGCTGAKEKDKYKNAEVGKVPRRFGRFSCISDLRQHCVASSHGFFLRKSNLRNHTLCAGHETALMRSGRILTDTETAFKVKAEDKKTGMWKE
jgi:hypothetical protein